jgi:NAD(P)-dependent dehydrogenase (short-subunit alcohol dehydrogenase family)
MTFESFGQNLRCVVVGSSGGIGAAMVDALVESEQVSRIHALSRTGRSHPSPKVANLTFDFTDEDSLIAAAQALQEVKPFDIVIVATGKHDWSGYDREIFCPAITARRKSCLCCALRAGWEHI